MASWWPGRQHRDENGRLRRDDGRPHLVPHPRGPWLLYLRGRCFLVPPALGRSLARAEEEPAPAGSRKLLAGIRAAARAAPPRRDRAALRLRLTLLRGAWVDALARRLQPAASWPALAVQIVLGLVAYWLGCQRPLDASLLAGDARMAAALGIFLVLAIWHELGHAAALRHEGYPAGSIGIALMLVVPVLFCDVTPVAALPRRGRLRVDVAGCAFQLAAGGALFLAGAWLGQPILRWAASCALLAVCWSLLPFIRTDGHWILADALELPSLDEPLPSTGTGAISRRRRLLAAGLAVFRLAQVVLVALVFVALPWRFAARWHVDGLVARLPAALRPDPVAVRGVLAILVLALFPRFVRRMARLVRSAATDLRTAAGRAARPSS